MTSPLAPLDQEMVLARLGLQRRPGAGPLLACPAFEVGAATSEGGVFVGWLDVGWDGPATPVWRLRGVTHVPERQSADEVQLRTAISAAQRARTRSLRRCEVCGERHRPGHMHDRTTCQGCAERELGVVH